MAPFLFWAAIILATITSINALRGNEEIKRFFVALPFILLLAAAVAKYLGL